MKLRSLIVLHAARLLVVLLSLHSLAINVRSVDLVVPNAAIDTAVIFCSFSISRNAPRIIFLERLSGYAGNETVSPVRPMALSSRSRSLNYSEMTWVYNATLDESDEIKATLEQLHDPHCQPAAAWQLTSHPVCNELHSVCLVDNGKLLRGDGTWREPWQRQDLAGNTTTLWKTLKMKHFNDVKGLEILSRRNRIESQAMERLTASTTTVDVYAYCGTSMVNQFAATSLSSYLQNKTSLEKLSLAIAITKGIVDMHSIDNTTNNNRKDSTLSLAHHDFKSDNVRFTADNRAVMTDMNSAILLQRHNETGVTCPSVSYQKGSPWRPPEEYQNRTTPKLVVAEMVDIYGLANFFYLFAVGMEPWEISRMYPVPRYKRKKYREIMMQRRNQGKPRYVPDDVWRSKDPAIQLLLNAMKACYRSNPAERPTAKEVVAMLENRTNLTT